MSTLQTYEYPRDHDLVRWGSRALSIAKPWLAVNCVPGEWVEHKSMLRPGKGMLVANGDDFITVLWSVEPSNVEDDDIAYVQQKLASALKIPQEYLNGPTGKLNLQYNPLAVDEDIYIPVRVQPNERKRLKDKPEPVVVRVA